MKQIHRYARRNLWLPIAVIVACNWITGLAGLLSLAR